MSQPMPENLAPTPPSSAPLAPLETDDRQIQWCLLSHTNIGKTTLTRTLLADDVGEIQDAAHVTSQSQRYLLQTDAEGDQLWLWDTPGFGDSVRLYERLKQQGNPLGWFLSNVWDRWRDKPFYMSQRALVGALVGAVTFAGAAWGANKMFDQEAQHFRLSSDYLTALAGQALLKYLVISHYGRGRGRYSAPSAPQQWNAAVQTAIEQHRAEWQALWSRVTTLVTPVSATDDAAFPLAADAQAEEQAAALLLEQCLDHIWQTLYPSIHASSTGVSANASNASR